MCGFLCVTRSIQQHATNIHVLGKTLFFSHFHSCRAHGIDFLTAALTSSCKFRTTLNSRQILRSAVLFYAEGNSLATILSVLYAIFVRVIADYLTLRINRKHFLFQVRTQQGYRLNSFRACMIARASTEAKSHLIFASPGESRRTHLGRRGSAPIDLAPRFADEMRRLRDATALVSLPADSIVIQTSTANGRKAE